MSTGTVTNRKKTVLSIKEQMRLIEAVNVACHDILGSLDCAEPNGDRKFEYYHEDDHTNVMTCTINLEKWTCSCKDFKKHRTFCAHLASAYLMVTDWDCGDTTEEEEAELREMMCPLKDEVFSEDYTPGDSTE